MSRKNPQDRFFTHVNKTSGCWLWTASTNAKGYGQFPNTLIPGQKAHRVSFFIANGYLPSDLCVLHKCDNPPCVNPDHLFLGTRKDNAVDKVAKGRHRNGIMLGSRNPKSKITESDAVEIRNSTEPPSVLAERFSLRRCEIWRIRTRQTWRHV